MISRIQSSTDSAGFKLARVLFGVAMWLLAPVAFFALLALPNEYQAMGIEGGVDQDGPALVFMCAVPALLAYAPGFVLFAGSAVSTRRIGTSVIAIVSGLVCLGLIAQVTAATREFLRARQEESSIAT